MRFKSVWGQLLLSGSLLLGTSGCKECDNAVRGSGHVASVNQVMPAFDAVEINGIGKLKITTSDNSRVQISADDNLLPYVTARVEEGVLKIDTKRMLIPRSEIVIEVFAPTIKKLSSAGAGSITFATVNNDVLEVLVQGAGSVMLAGQAKVLKLNISGAGNVDALGLNASEVDAELNGVGNVQVHASDTINANVSGVGQVVYTGDPKVKANISGLGTVHKKSE